MKNNVFLFPASKIIGPEPFLPSSEVWSIGEIASYIRMSPNAVYHIVNRAGFPSSIGNPKRNRRWLAQDVKAYFETYSRNPDSTVRSSWVDLGHEPSTIVFKD
jgi:hypothetical protein